MEPERWKAIEDAFDAALQRPSKERHRFLEEAYGDDPELRREVESLLSGAAEADFMENSPGSLSLNSLDAGPLEGHVLNHYRIGPLIGSGGMAQVYRARDTKLERDVALKVLRNIDLLEQQDLSRIFREARLLATLNHPNVASIYGLEQADGFCALVLEFIEGDTLAERIVRSPLSFEEAVRIASQIAVGLEAAHSKGIVHRDLKPSNIKLTPEGTVKIIDFGIAKLVNNSGGTGTITDLSRQGVIAGTVSYMSPEQARGKPIDLRTDVWAFGCVLYEMVCRKPAFHGETLTDIIIKIASEEPDWDSLPKTASSDLNRLLSKCLQKDPERRYGSVHELSVDLHAVRQGSPSTKPQGAAGEDEFVLPVQFAPALFMTAQFGYLALYAAAMYHIDAIAKILARDFQVPPAAAPIATIVLAMCGVAVRVYLISSIGWRHPEARRKFMQLFPLLVVLDAIWAASPLLLWPHLGYGMAFAAVVLLAYVPFAQRTLVRTIYPRNRR